MLMKAKFCDQCGKPLVENARFCVNCGAKLPEPYEKVDSEPAAVPKSQIVSEPTPDPEPTIVAESAISSKPVYEREMESILQSDNKRTQIGPSFMKVDGSPFKKDESITTSGNESEDEHKAEIVSESDDRIQVGPKYVSTEGSPFKKVEPIVTEEPVAGFDSESAPEIDAEPEIEPETEPDDEQEPETADKLEIPKFATDSIADPIFDPEPESEFEKRDPEETLDRINIPEFSNDGEETVYLGANAGRDEPESKEQRFSRLAPIAELVKERTGEKIVIDRPEFVLGKNPNHADYAIRDNNTVSRIHASITWNDEGYTIADLGSMNGTFVNSETVDVAGQLLHNGDMIELSDEKFRLTIRDIK